MNDRERWESLVDADALDEALSDEEQAFLDELDDPELDAEREVYAALAQQGQPGPLLAIDRERALATLAEHRARQAANDAAGPASGPARAPARPARWAALAGVAGIAAALLLWVKLPEPTTATTTETDGATVASGHLMFDRAELGAGDALPVDRWVVARDEACVTVGETRGCVKASTRLRVHGDAIELGEGTLEVSGRGELTVGDSTIVVDDGRLVLEWDGEHGSLRVTEGSAQLRDGDGATQTVDAGTTESLGGPQTIAAAAVPGASAEAAEPAVDPVDGSPTETESEPEAEIEVETEGAPTSEPRRARSTAPKAPAPTAGELLSAARRHVAAGEVGKALGAYATLRREHPKSPEAHAANVSVGELELRRGKARAALDAFTRYANGGGGPLIEEARWGTIRALDALGRTAERDAAIEQLRRAHPGSVYLARAARLQ